MNHKRISKPSIILTLALLVVLVSVVPASAQAERLSFTGTTCIQNQTPP